MTGIKSKLSCAQSFEIVDIVTKTPRTQPRLGLPPQQACGVGSEICRCQKEPFSRSPDNRLVYLTVSKLLVSALLASSSLSEVALGHAGSGRMEVVAF